LEDLDWENNIDKEIKVRGLEFECDKRVVSENTLV
jgi:hypothetical protein